MSKQKGKTSSSSANETLKTQILNFTHRQKQMVMKRLRSHLQRINPGNQAFTEKKILEAIDELLEDEQLVMHSVSGKVPIWRCSDEVIQLLDEERAEQQKDAEEATLRKAEEMAKLEAERGAKQAEMDEIEARMREQEEKGRPIGISGA